MTRSTSNDQPRFLTIGHSTRSLDEFIQILQRYAVTRLVDVRTVPRSRRNPQFNRDTLPDSLAAAGISYTHIPALGGFRKPLPNSPNSGWRNESFRGYADYMQTEEFSQNINDLIHLAEQDVLALMCAEATPWRCHRSLIADVLTVRGYLVEDIYSLTSSQTHLLTSWAQVKGSNVIYPPGESPLQDPSL